MYRIIGHNVPEAWEEFKWTFYGVAREEDSRNGPVWSVPFPSMIEITNPMQRVMFDPQRDCNPFFHVMEFIWMMSGSKELKWITQFNKQLGAYSDDHETLPASYGYRWRRHFGVDQVVRAVEQLQSEPQSRRVVLGMWDPRVDLGSVDPSAGLDKPCNTQIYFRAAHGVLDMLVTNRSNDAIWGLFGANAVHMSFLHELVARASGITLGTLRTVTNNLHVYKNLPNVEKIMAKAGPTSDYYTRMGYDVHPVLSGPEKLHNFLDDAEVFVRYPNAILFACKWFTHVAAPMRDAYLSKITRGKRVCDIMAQDWRVAATQWAERHE